MQGERKRKQKTPLEGRDEILIIQKFTGSAGESGEKEKRSGPPRSGGGKDDREKERGKGSGLFRKGKKR